MSDSAAIVLNGFSRFNAAAPIRNYSARLFKAPGGGLEETAFPRYSSVDGARPTWFRPNTRRSRRYC